MKKIGIFTWHDIKNSYSCLLYLQKELQKYYLVDIWARTSRSQTSCKNYFSLTDTWYGSIRRARIYLAKIKFYYEAKKYDVIIINDLDFFRGAYYIKKKYPSKIIIHYNTEIHGKDVRYPKHTVDFYENHADFPDMIIECLDERAKFRKEKYNINKEVFVINNTIPKENVESALEDDSINVLRYFNFEKELPVVVYAGGCDLSRSLGDIIESMGEFDDELNYMLFCYGNKNDVKKVYDVCSRYKNCCLYPAVDRKTLLKIMYYCDIGIQYYDPELSINHMYASPSKFFEYISVGINVISSDNCGINKIIKDNNLGVCFDKNEGFVDATRRLLNKGLQNKDAIQQIFNDKFCYEIDSEIAINKIREIIKA